MSIIRSGILSTVRMTKHTVYSITKTLKTSAVKAKQKQWSLGKLNHVALACHDLEKATAFYRDVLGAQVSTQVDLPKHGVTTVFVNLGNTKFELLSPIGDNSPIKAFLEKNKVGGIHHLCIEVDNIDAAMTELQHHNIRCLTREPKIGAHGKPVVFLHPKDCGGVLVELEQA